MKTQNPYTLGIDAGSSYIKLLLMDAADQVIGKTIIPRGAQIAASCRDARDALVAALGLDPQHIAGIMATGYGRKQVDFADAVITEITALAVGAYHLDPETRTIIDVGGQDSKVITLDDSGRVIDFVMNQKCAAGTGKFLEVTSASLGVSMEELGPLSLQADKPLKLTSTCTVFAESEIISCIAAGEKKENIIKALHNTIAGQILGLFFQANADRDGKIMFTGGVALNQGMVTELSNKLNRPLCVPDDPRFVGARGAALFLKTKRS